MMATSSPNTWEISIRSKPGWTSPAHQRIVHEIAALQPSAITSVGKLPVPVETQHGFVITTTASRTQLEHACQAILVDGVLESAELKPVGETPLSSTTATVMLKPGVMDPIAQSAGDALPMLSVPVESFRTYSRFVFPDDTNPTALKFLADKLLANQAIELVVFGGIADHLATPAGSYHFKLITIPILDATDDQLKQISTQGGLSLNLTEMQTIKAYFQRLGRNPTDIELETIAQTWSEHCSHKTLRGPYTFNGKPGQKGLLKDTIMRATEVLRSDWLVSVFVDNAGVVKFNDDWNVCFKVETHNHPSAIEPYGGANTGIGGVIRDPMGTGLGAKPICNTDVFCFAPPETPHETLPVGVLHPLRVMRGVVSGVRDYGNRMGIPTVNGAVCFDDRYLGNPIVYCGTVGLIPADRSVKTVQPGDLIVALGGRTGRDGIHGATFSSIELTTESETVSGGAVQIGNAITQKKLLDVLLQARDRQLYRAVTDCGAGGFSSAVGEMGESLGAIVDLESAKLKYEGLSYTEIWISESQERMVLAVPPENWHDLKTLAESENVEALVLGRFEETGKLQLRYQGETVGELEMEFLHNGRPSIVRDAIWHEFTAPAWQPANNTSDMNQILLAALAHPNVASKEWIIRQYDHEVQGNTIIKPLVGVDESGPSDAAVVRPIVTLNKGLAIANGINPRYGDIDPYRMAASAIDEAVRNVVAVGGDPEQIAILDNFCWGNTERPEIFGSLCQAAFACRDVAIALGTPFISGKDSLYNEFLADGKRIVIPPTLLISAMGIVPDITCCVTMDAKEPGNWILLLGETHVELGGSILSAVTNATGGEVPDLQPGKSRRMFQAVHRMISNRLIRSCHDLSDGGLAVAAAEMAFAGGLGMNLDLSCMAELGVTDDLVLLFSESNSRFLVEVAPEHLDAVRAELADLPYGILGQVSDSTRLEVKGLRGSTVINLPLADLKSAWQKTLKY